MSFLDRSVSFLLPAVPKSIVRRFSSRYIAGVTVDDAFRVVRTLAAGGAMATLDILGEFVETPEQATRNARAYEDLLRRIARDGLPGTNVSVKLTSLGLLLDRNSCRDLLRGVVAVAREHGNFVRIDMEDARCTDATIAVYRTLRDEFPGHVGIVLQSRLRRTIRDAESLAGPAANFRLCKGIYLEPRAIAYTDPELITRNFAHVLEHMLREGSYVGIATHDERVVWDALRLIRELALAHEQYEFQMLLGVDEALRSILLRAGHRLRVYVPFGEEWYAYSVRRLRENPQIAGHALRAIFKSA